MEEVEIDFADASTQIFHIGEESVAVPGLVPGLEEAHERRGSLPWERLFVPALELAARAFQATESQAFLHEILVPILQREPGGRRVYGTVGVIDATDALPSLRLLRDARSEALPILFGDLVDDLAAYRVEEREPLECAFVDGTVLTTPAPSIGGAIVRAGLESLDEGDRPSPGSVDDARALARALAIAYGGHGAGAGARPTGTTHVSVVDTDGAAVGVSSTLGSGSGVFRGGFQLNNMLGELDVIGEGPQEPGARLPSMMTPTVVLDAEGRPRLVAGSAGSVRLAGAILQVVDAVVGHGLPVDEAIARPRLHVDGDVAHVEGGWPDEVAPALEDEGFDVRRWAARNLFFGGVSAVERRAGDVLGAAGDPRRGGHGVVVR
jgi:gamma-glutamyltranspeptidase/glutathione hydrolase